MKTSFKKCPDCGKAMEAKELVPARHHFSRWWRCSNGQCRAEWLLPMCAAEQEEILQAWAF